MSRGKVDYEIYSSRDEPKELYKQAASLMRIFEDENIDKKNLLILEVLMDLFVVL